MLVNPVMEYPAAALAPLIPTPSMLDTRLSLPHAAYEVAIGANEVEVDVKVDVVVEVAVAVSVIVVDV